MESKLVKWVVGVPLVLAILIALIICIEPTGDGISRATVAKAVVLAIQSQDDLESWESQHGQTYFSVETMTNWYVPYFDYLYSYGFFSTDQTPAEAEIAEGMITYGEVALIAGTVSSDLEDLIQVKKSNQDENFPEELWWLFYESFLAEVDEEQAVTKTEILIYGTPKNIPQANSWTAYTNFGTIYFKGLVLDTYIDHQITAFMRDDEMIYVITDDTTKVTYQNVWITQGDEEEATLYLGDIERTIPFQKTSKKTSDMVNHLADIELADGEITKVSIKQDTIRGKVLAVNESYIELEGYGKVPLDSEYKVLKTYGTLERESLLDVFVGYDMHDFVVAKGSICAVLITQPFEVDTLRVLIMNQGFQGIFHDSIEVSCNGNMTIIKGEEEKLIPAGETISWSKGDGQILEERIFMKPEEGFEIKIHSFERAQGMPSYAGILELVETNDGLILVNDLDLEEYLKKVVPSEMPASYEKEALKAQAICARTYAYRQVQSNTYRQYGAHVDDSTNFQVYNNIQTDERTNVAVQETYGKLLTYGGEPIEAFYHSTSCGNTTDAAIWGGNPDDLPYIQSIGLQPGGKELVWESEDEFATFIKRTNVSSFDAEYTFFRWTVKTNNEVLTKHISGVGTVESVEITQRGAGGIARVMKVTGTEGTKEIIGQNSIRAALGDGDIILTDLNGTERTGWTSLPSSFLSIEQSGSDYVIYGGGYGHGVGMSQNGAQGMAKLGMTCEEILTFFYSNIKIEEMK